MIRIALADQLAHDALSFAVGLRDRVEDAVPLVLDSATGRPAVQRFLTRRGGKLFGKGDQLDVHQGADADRHAMGQAWPSRSSTLARICCPPGVSTDSGWNCTPTCFAALSLIAIAIPSIAAWTWKRGGGLGVHSE